MPTIQWLLLLSLLFLSLMLLSLLLGEGHGGDSGIGTTVYPGCRVVAKDSRANNLVVTVAVAVVPLAAVALAAVRGRTRRRRWYRYGLFGLSL
eukprot:jgi/Psemu1/308891/fgenesh1_kg.454_\